jgi:GlpG protein
MRQLVTLPSAETAQTLADYLLTLHIETKLEQQPDGWVVWVRDEDQVAHARRELEEFNRNPADPRYISAPRQAEALRRQRQRDDASFHRRQARFNRRMSGPIASERWTVALIAICVLVSLLSEGGSSYSTVVQTLSIAPFRFTEGGIISPGPGPILHGEVWRLVTPILLHFGIWHLLFDMYMLHTLGGAIERIRGPLRYLSLVLVLAIVSNLVQYYLGHPSWDGSVLRLYLLPNFGGMSGVVYGLFGYIWMKARFHPELGLRIQPSTVVYLMAWFFVCMTGWFGPIANGAHLGGLIAGILIGYVPILWHSPGSD